MSTFVVHQHDLPRGDPDASHHEINMVLFEVLGHIDNSYDILCCKIVIHCTGPCFGQ